MTYIVRSKRKPSDAPIVLLPKNVGEPVLTYRNPRYGRSRRYLRHVSLLRNAAGCADTGAATEK